jgi:hypothetical protein
LRKGLGGGAFDSPLYIASTRDKDLWDIGDLDADGDFDIGVVQGGKMTVIWNHAPGSISWTHEDIYNNMNGDNETEHGCHLLDVNDDGLLDIVAWGGSSFHINSAPNASSVFLRLADNTGFEPPTWQVFKPTAYRDADGDGDVDLFTDRLYKNRRYEGDTAGSRRQFGNGSPGTGGIAPVLGQSGPARIGELTEIRVRGAVGGGAGQIKFAFAESNLQNYPFPGMTGYAQPWFRRLGFHCDGVPGAQGDGTWTFSVVIPAGLVGTTFYHQVYVADAGAPNGWSSTNGIEMTYR